MDKSTILKALGIVSTLYRVEEINIERKNKMLTLIMNNDDGAFNKELHRIREFSSLKSLIDGYLNGFKEKGGNNYGED